MKYSVIITAYKESATIGKAIRNIVDSNLSGFDEEFELIQVSPDQKTLDTGKKVFDEIGNRKVSLVQIQDEQKGKPHALNMAFRQVNGDIVILTDGDVCFHEKSLGVLLNSFGKLKSDGACGRVISMNDRNQFMGYISHMMTDAAHHKRMIELKENVSGHGKYFVHKHSFFPLSGYMLIFNKKKLEDKLGEGFVFPTDCLVEDAYLSYVLFNYGLKLDYIPEAKVNAVFPTTLSDYMKQKKRSTGGYIQLWKYGVVKEETKARSFWHDLQYFWFPFKFASNIQEYIWSLLFFPIRLYLWLKIWWERKILRKDFAKTWVRVESTK